MTPDIKISVITAVYNNRMHIADAIQSVLSQDFPNIEYIVVDGGSTDGTLEVIDQYRSRIDKFTSGRDGGIYQALNKGIDMASGDYIGFLHSDDLFASPNALSTLFAKTAPKTDALYGNLDFIDRLAQEKVVRRWKSSSFQHALLDKGWMPPHPTLYVRRELMLSLGGFNPQYRICADYDFILRLFSRPDIHTHYEPLVIVNMRTGGASNNSLRNAWRKYQENARILESNGFNGKRVAAMKILGKVHQFVPDLFGKIDRT